MSGSTVTVQLNSNAKYPSTVQDVLDGINNSIDAEKIVQARLISGSAAQRIGTNSTAYSPLQLVSGDDQLIVPAYIGLGDTKREVVIRFASALPDDSYLIDILGRGPSHKKHGRTVL